MGARFFAFHVGGSVVVLVGDGRLEGVAGLRHGALELLKPLPTERPSSGSRFGPKTIQATISTSRISIGPILGIMPLLRDRPATGSLPTAPYARTFKAASKVPRSQPFLLLVLIRSPEGRVDTTDDSNPATRKEGMPETRERAESKERHSSRSSAVSSVS